MSVDRYVSNDGADDIDLAMLCHVIWTRKALVALVTLAIGLIVALVAFTMTPIFRAEVTITPTNDQGLGGGGELGGQLSGLASLAGVDLGVGQGPQKEALAVLKSNHLIEEFIRRNDLLPVLLPLPGKSGTLWRGVKSFQQGVLRIREDERQGTTVVAIEWKDPVLAARWANGFVALANELIRKHALEDSSRNIAYLKDQVARTDDVDLRRGLYELIENQTKTAMLANGRVEYAFRVVDPAVAPELKARPHRALMLLIGLGVGFVVGSMIAYWRHNYGTFKHRLAREG